VVPHRRPFGLKRRARWKHLEEHANAARHCFPSCSGMLIFDQHAVLGPQFLERGQPPIDARLAEDTLRVRAEKTIVIHGRIRFRKSLRTFGHFTLLDTSTRDPSSCRC
jgi:hypothetical protein